MLGTPLGEAVGTELLKDNEMVGIPLLSIGEGAEMEFGTPPGKDGGTELGTIFTMPVGILVGVATLGPAVKTSTLDVTWTGVELLKGIKVPD